jgi:hypothetical protein
MLPEPDNGRRGGSGGTGVEASSQQKGRAPPPHENRSSLEAVLGSKGPEKIEQVAEPEPGQNQPKGTA